MGRKSSPRSPRAEGGSRAASPPSSASCSPPSSPLWALPEELLLLICSYLDVQALGRLGQVCRRLRFLSSRDLLWKRIRRRALGLDVPAGLPCVGKRCLLPRERGEGSLNARPGRSCPQILELRGLSG
uniref:F-box domain-containing protein n=1 Tax=Phasianus colchicus TaxID=9054 RepID=A0A669PRU6_PHACC